MPIGRPGKKIMCVNDGKLYDSITSAAEYYKMSRSTISKQLTGQRSQASGLYFMYISDAMTQDQMELQRKKILEQVYNIQNL